MKYIEFREDFIQIFFFYCIWDKRHIEFQVGPVVVYLGKRYRNIWYDHEYFSGE